jgi:hypothetical protein
LAQNAQLPDAGVLENYRSCVFPIKTQTEEHRRRKGSMNNSRSHGESVKIACLASPSEILPSWGSPGSCVFRAKTRTLSPNRLKNTVDRKACPHTAQSDTTRCGVSGVGHTAKRPLSDPHFNLSVLLLNNASKNVTLLLDNNALFLLGNVVS